MDYFSPGFRELIRLARRTWARGQVFLARRNLREAETQLGLLGWQQADFDLETQRQVDAIQNVEREQGALTNRVAELAREIQTLAAERARVRAELEQQRATLEADRTSTRAPLTEIDRLLGSVRDRGPIIERNLAGLDREERETNELYNKLIVTNPQPPEMRDDILKLRDRLLAIGHERNDLKASAANTAEELQKREQERQSIEEKSAGFDRQLRELKAAAEQCDSEFATRAKDLEKEKARNDGTIHRLEHAKLDPYREIGRVLADSGVSPLNQPEAFSRVIDLRKSITTAEEAITASLAETAQENAELLRVSLGIWGVLIVGLLLVLGALL